MTVVAWQIGYAIVPMIARGIMLGPNQPVILHLLDIEDCCCLSCSKRKNLKLECDCIFKFLGYLKLGDIPESIDSVLYM
ncbi:hypothetical protein SO802_027998 [Lithocarpus litseifolius]|uniref:Uncharacterized protein n=1 Tax=Lithocarpus litseifolius TaxID=425828 RepID=A0AAW2BP31_9ROSI